MAVSKQNEENISKLLTNYNKLSGWRRWIFPVELTESTKELNTFKICNFLLNSWFSSLWRSVFPFLDSFAQSELYRSCQVINNFDLLTETNFNLVAAHEAPYKLWDVLTTIGIYYKEKLYDKYKLDLVFLTGSNAQANFERIAMHAEPIALIDAFDKFLSYDDIVSKIYASGHNLETTLQADFDTIARSPYAPSQVVDALHLLYCSQKKIEDTDRALIEKNPTINGVHALCFAKRVGLLKGDLGLEIHELMIKISNPFDAISVLYYLQLEGLLTGKRGKEICQGKAIVYSAKEIPPALKALHDFSLSSEKNRCKLLTGCYFPSILIDVLKYLKESHLLDEPITSQSNFDLAVENTHLEAFGSMVSSLHFAGLLNIDKRGQDNYIKVAEYGESLAPLLLLLSKNNLLNQEIFDRINQHHKSLRFHLWQKIPADAFRENDILEILHICDDNSKGQLAKMSHCMHYLRNTFLKKERVLPLRDESTPTDNKNNMDTTSLKDFTTSISTAFSNV